MSGDYTRFTFRPLKRYSGVWMQQGRVQLDSDWNEGVDILKDRVRKLSLDVLGPVGVPFLVTPDAFAVAVVAGPPLDLTIGAGRIYVDGHMAENFVPPATYLTQPFLPNPPALAPGDVVVVLDLWEREVTYIEDPGLLDVALGGVDTTTRIQQVWQVHVVAPPEGQGAQCGINLNALFPPSAGRLTTEAIAPPAPDDPCILPPVAGYRGLENRLYRVEIHNGGALGVARFKWSRDDGSIVSAVSAMAVGGGQTRLKVSRIGRDQVLRFRINDWVTVNDDHREFYGESGEMARIVDIDEAVPAIVLDRPLPSPLHRPFGVLPADLIARHTRVQLWNQNPAINALDADGLMLTGPGPIGIEDGIRVRFNMNPVGGSFHVGDYWVFAARTADASVEILTQEPPRGIIHHYAQLAAISGLGGGNGVSDCRPRHRDCACCCVINVAPPNGPAGDFNSLADAVAALPGLPINPAAPVLICLMQGEHPVAAPINLQRPSVTIRGCGQESIVRPVAGFINLNGPFQVLEDFAIQAESTAPLISFNSLHQRMSRLQVRNRGPGPIAFARGSQFIVIEDCEITGSGGVDLAAIEVDIQRNHIFEGPVVIRSPSVLVRIWDNRLERSPTQGISLQGGERGGGFVVFIDILRNYILGAQGSGIGAAGGDFGPLVAWITIADNEILGCVASEAAAGVLPVVGGIVLGRAAELLVQDNRITGNGTSASTAVCGIYVLRSYGVEITHNLIYSNGRPAGDTAFSGPQAGIYLANTRSGVGASPNPNVITMGVVPAARISGNDVDAPRGHALVILGAGPMIVESNRLQCYDIIGKTGGVVGVTPLENLLNWIGTVVIIDLGLPSWLYLFLLANGFSGTREWGSLTTSGFSIPDTSLLGGHVQFRGNQVRLDLSQTHAELALANMFIASLDDIQFVDNQSEGLLRFNPRGVVIAGPAGSFDFLLADLAAFGITIRQADNGLFTTPFLTAFSILSSALVNHCLGNQTTSCISAVGSAPKSKRRDNAVLFPHPIFCANAGRGED